MSLYTLTVDLLAKTGSFERDMGRAAHVSERDARRIEQAATRMGVALGAALAGAATGMTVMVKRTMDTMAETSKMAGQIGVATEQLTALRYAAQQMAGVSDGQFDMALRRMTRRISEAAAGGGPAAKAIEAMGLSAKELARLSPDEQFRRIAEGIKATSEQGTRLQHVMALMDTEGMPLVNMLQQGAAAMGEWELAAARLGLTFSSQTAKQAEEFRQQMDRVTGAMVGFGRQVTGELLPTMNELADRFVGIHNDGELAKTVAEGIGTSFRAAAAGIKVMADVLPPVLAGLTALTTVKVTQAMGLRLQATLANIQADRAATVAAVASAKATEAKAAAHVVEAGMALRAANTNRQRILAERALTAAVNDHTAARQRLAAAELAAARASAGLAARSGRAALALLGGPTGLLLTIGATAAAWWAFRDNTEKAESALANWTGTADEAVAKFREMNAEMRAGELLSISEELRDLETEVNRALGGLLTAQGRAVSENLHKPFRDGIRELREEWLEGAIDADELTSRARKLAAEFARGAGLTGELADKHVRLLEQLARNAIEADALRTRHASLTSVNEQLGRAASGASDEIRLQTEQMEAAAAAATNWGNKIQSAIRDLPGQIERVGKSARELAELDVRDWIYNQALAEGITSEDDPRFKALQEQGQRYIELQTQLAAATEAARTAKGATTATDRQTESLARYNREAEAAAATLAGPLQQAEIAHRHRLADLDAELKKGNISQAAYNTLKAEAADQLERNTRALQEQQRAPADLLGAMREEMELLGMIGPEREIYRRGLQAEREMRDAINRANEAGAGINDEVGESLIRQARAWGVASVEIEEAARAAEAWQWTVMGSVEGVADVFTDLFTGQIKSTRDFFTELKDLWKRGWWDIVRMSMQQSFVNPIQRALAGVMSGQGFAGAGMGPGVMAQGMAGNVLLGGAGATAIGAGTAAGGVVYPGWGFGGPGVAGVAGPGGFGAGGGFGWPGGIPSKNLLTGEFAGGMPYASAVLGVLGAYYGLTQRGNNALTSGLAGLSYGAMGIGVGGAIAGGLGAIGIGAGLAGVGAGAMGGATSAMGTAAGAIGGASWIPVVGWTLAALGAIDAISGGRLFGTKYQAQSITQDIGIDAYGGVASASVHETRKRSLFRGTARRDREIETSAEQRQAAAELYDAMEQVARSAASQLGLETVKIIGGSIRQVYDARGNLQSELSTVLGRTFEETFDDFASRLTSEQLIAAVGQIDSAASRIAQDWRHSAELLAAGADYFMNAASDARNGLDLWTQIGLQGLTDFVQHMQMGEESLTEAYRRVAGLAQNYGTLMADIETQMMTAGLSGWQSQALQIERTYRDQVRAANEYAKALGLSGARAEDLAKIEELRAHNMAALQAQMEADNAAFLGQLALSDLSTLRDDQKLQEVLQQMADAVAGGDTRAAQQAAQAALGFGRNLYASGRDYQILYDQVTGALRDMLPSEGDLDVGDLADQIMALEEGFARAIFELAAESEQVITAPIRAEQQRTNELLEQVLGQLQRTAELQRGGALWSELNGAVMLR